MSITALAMITDAFRKANIIDQVQAPSAEQGQSGLRMLNQMVADWEADGVRIGWAVVGALGDNLPIEAADERGILYNLALAICGDYGIEPSAEVATRAEETFARFAKSSSNEVVADMSGLPCEDAICNMAWPTG